MLDDVIHFGQGFALSASCISGDLSMPRDLDFLMLLFVCEQHLDVSEHAHRACFLG